VHAYAVPHPGPRSESSSGSASAEPDTDNPEFRADGGMLLDQRSEDEQPCVWFDRIDKTYGFQYDWKLEEWGVEHDDGGDLYMSDEYGYNDFLDST